MRVIVALVCVGLKAGAVWAVIADWPLILNSNIERIHGKNLLRLLIEKGCIIYCRTGHYLAASHRWLAARDV